MYDSLHREYNYSTSAFMYEFWQIKGLTVDRRGMRKERKVGLRDK